MFSVCMCVCVCVLVFGCKMSMVADSSPVKAELVQLSYLGVGKAP